MTKIFGLCPRCKSRIKINNVERLDGRKIACRDCGYTIRIRAGQAKAPSSRGRRQPQELEITEFFDEDGEEVLIENLQASAVDAFDDEEFSAPGVRELPALRPLARQPKPKKKTPQYTDDEAGETSFVPAEKSTARKGKMSPLKIVGISVGFLIGFAAAFAGISLLRSGGGGSAKFEPPEKYVALQVGLLPLAGQMPDGWKTTAGGGRSGIPIYVRINDGGSISVEIRETEGSSAKGKMKKAIASGQEFSSFGSKEDPIGMAPSVEGTHAYHKSVVMKNFSNYKESSSQPIETGFGGGLISDFTAEEGLFHAKVKGCRASLVHAEHQYNIVCKCPPAQFKEVKPVFEKIIASLNPDEGPAGRR